MPVLVWDKVGERVYENGVDKGVVYLPDGSAVPWNGLTEIIEKFDRSVEPIFYDGIKINDFVTIGSFSASMKAVSYPSALQVFEGILQVRDGFYVTDQQGTSFGLCYRTMVGNDVEGDRAGYKIHVVYNVTVLPQDKTYSSFSADPAVLEYEWEVTSVPAEVEGFRPTAHVIIDSRELDPLLLQDIERILYGDQDEPAHLPPIDELVDFVDQWYRLKIVDNGDGTWTAIEYQDGAHITFLPGQEFIIDNCNAVYLDEVTFLISDTLDINDVPEIDIEDNTDGTWMASTSHDNLIEVEEEEQLFEIKNANAIFLDEDTYQIEDTFE